LKSKAGKATSSTHCTSGTTGSAPSPPAPPVHACLKTGFCLWDVVADPYEHSEISEKHPDVVATLKTKMANVLKSFQYQLDPNCGEPVYENSSVGQAWAPWCYNDNLEITV